MIAALVAAPASAQRVQQMSVEQAHEASRSGKMVLVDIRTPREWRDSGIPATAVAMDMTGTTFLRDLRALRDADPQRTLGLICASGGRSRYLAALLVANGIRDIVDVTAGMHTGSGWLARGLPVRAPDAPLPAVAPATR
jgi:rhodanese-related sulfurtransferase